MPFALNTLGDHIRARRIGKDLMQRDAAKIIGVSEDSVTYWENNRAQPQIRHYRAIIAFLGYYPFDHETESFAGRLRQLRYSLGYTYKQLGAAINVNGSTVRGWEHSINIPTMPHRLRMMALIEQSSKPQYPSK
ncbi:helix-turn-helix domain-containing protein [Mucilaginibacter sp.]